MTENTDNEWINEAPRLAGLKKPAVDMPHESYFESFHSQLKARLESASEWENEYPVLAGISKPSIETPDNEYFNSLSENLVHQVAENQEWSVEHTLLSGTQKPVLVEPDDAYFQALPSEIMARINKEETPIIKLIPAMMRYAAIAACMAGTMWLYKGLVDSMPQDSFAASVNVYEADIENMPLMYDSEELSVYLDNEKAVTAESNSEMEELNRSIDSSDELESMIGM